MKLRVVNSDYQKNIYPIKFIRCSGDENLLCDDCKARFFCYTGELPSQFSGDIARNYASSTELKILGKIEHRITYDYETHNRYYDQRW